MKLRKVPWIVLALVAAAAASASPSGAASAARDARLVSSTASAVSFEVSVPAARIVSAGDGLVRVLLDGFGTFSPAGAVELPGKTFRIAIPAEGRPRVSASVVEEENLGSLALARVAGERFIGEENGVPVSETYYPPDPWAVGYEPPVVSALEPSFMGRQRVLAVRVSPLALDEKGAHLARKISITVAFEGVKSSGGSLAAAVPLSGTWKRLYEDLLVNPDDVSKFRKPLAEPRLVSAPIEAGKRLKIRVSETGFYTLRADSLIAAGLSPGLATGMIALRNIYYDASSADLARHIDVPVLVAEDAAGAPGIFDGGDLLMFYALGIKDDADALDTDALYTDDNILWLEEDTAGESMGEGAPLPTSAGPALDRGAAVMKSRKDTYYMKNVLAGDTDFYFVSRPNTKQASLSFSMSHPVAAETFSLSLRAAGNDRDATTYTLSFSLRNSSGTYAIGAGTITGMAKKTFVFDLPGSWLVDGQNELLIATSVDYIYLVNDFRIDYSTHFVAENGVLEFGVGPFADVRTIEITGLATNRGYLVEITDPRSPLVHTLSPADFVADGAGYKISINLTADAARRFVMASLGSGAAIPVSSISVDTPSHLREATLPATVLVISHANFMQRIGEYVAWRRTQGWRAMTADVEDVFDEWNGGLPSAHAIKRFIGYAVERWGTEYVILVGDGNEDHKRVFLGDPPDQKGSPPDYVPSFTYCVDVTGELNDEVVASDKWYEFLDEALPVSVAPGGASAPGEKAELLAAAAFYPDVIVGRMPFGSDIEMRALLNKLYEFEAPSPEETWRRRIVLFSDDAWSGGGNDYRYRPASELEFENSTDECRNKIETALPGGFDVQKLYLSIWTDPIHPNLYESGTAVRSKSIAATRATFTPALIRELNKGCLFFGFQGHANRSVLTTEAGFATYAQYDDADSLRTSIPHVFLGFGCHISDFARAGELNFWTADGPNGDCLSEQLLFKPGAGAVGTYASDGFEYLNQNAVLCERLFKDLFQAPPADSVAPLNEYTGAHLILGEALTKAEIEQLDLTDYGIEMVLRYHLLGDPLLRVDPGPPLMRLQASWSGPYQDVSPDTIRPRGGSNLIELRFLVSDVVAIGPVVLLRNGEDVGTMLEITKLGDLDKTYGRSYQADYAYIADPNDETLVFKAFSPAGLEIGSIEIPIPTSVRLFYNDYLEILPGVESPPSGTFRFTLDVPAYLEDAPVLSIDGVEQHDVHFTVPDAANGLHWEAAFERTLKSGVHVFTATSGNFTRDFNFVVTGDELVANVYSFPNPFGSETNIVYSLNLPVDRVSIDLYNVSGMRIRTLDLPSDKLNAASAVSPHSVLWDGRDVAGDRVANGTYIYVVRIERGGESVEVTGKSVKLE